MPQFPKRTNKGAPSEQPPILTPEQEAILGEPDAPAALGQPAEPTPGPEAVAAAEEVAAPPTPSPEDPLLSRRPKKWRVTEDGRASWFGQLIHLSKGDELDEASYGTDGIRRIGESVRLEEVT